MAPEKLAVEFARANPQWGTQRGAKDECYSASCRYGMKLSQYMPCRLIIADCGIGDHVAVDLPDGRVVDLTMRQYDPTAPFPLITDSISWRVLMQTTFQRHTFFRFDRVA